ncbi:hypothetical protein VN97_g5371 [Penicillium thymicola]|uniref:Uncharacterized protein n=1 Tax=Penicillium thymicola TaxID=293382 RepID=A0AAI9X8R5_PENTH|nr:hypothetical protein VN97_g5371 [Penicillium thymicola]
MVHHSESEVPAPIVTHIEQLFSSGLPHLNPSDMTLPQTEKVFNIKEARGLQIQIQFRFSSDSIQIQFRFNSGIQTSFKHRQASINNYNISFCKVSVDLNYCWQYEPMRELCAGGVLT